MLSIRQLKGTFISELFLVQKMAHLVLTMIIQKLTKEFTKKMFCLGKKLFLDVNNNIIGCYLHHIRNFK